MTDTSPTIRDRSLATLSPVLGRYFQQAWVRGEGHRLFDSDGRSYLDFANGIAVTSLGHAHPRVNAAIHAQVDQLLHVCNGLGHLEPVTRLAEMIVEEMPDGPGHGLLRQLRRGGRGRRPQAGASRHAAAATSSPSAAPSTAERTAPSASPRPA